MAAASAAMLASACAEFSAAAGTPLMAEQYGQRQW